MKVCFRCKKSKPLKAFTKNSSFPSGFQYDCRECRAIERKARNKKHNEESVIYRQKNPLKVKAHKVIELALLRGEIERPETCEDCSEEQRLHGHHDDYSKPLDVRWLCQPCHQRFHREAKKRWVKG